MGVKNGVLVVLGPRTVCIISAAIVYRDYVRITVEPSVVLVPIVEGANRRVRSSSTVFAINSPKWTASETGGAVSVHILTGFPFSNDNTASIKDIFELSKIKITICSTGGGARGYNRFLDS